MIKVLITILLKIVVVLSAFSQKIFAKELIEQPANAVLIENFYQISLNDESNFTSNSSIGFIQDDKCYIQNFQREDGLKGQLIIQLDFAGKIQYIGISKVFIDKYKNLLKPKIFLIDDIAGCMNNIGSNWTVANCIVQKIISYMSGY
jgi:hypothetical protein